MLQVLDTGMGTPKHPLFLMGKRFDNTGKPTAPPAQLPGPAAVQSQAVKAKLIHSLTHAAMTISHCWQVKVAHHHKKVSKRCSSNSLAAGTQPAANMEPKVGRHTSEAAHGCCEVEMPTSMDRHVTGAVNGPQQHARTGADIEAQHAAISGAATNPCYAGSDNQHVQPVHVTSSLQPVVSSLTSDETAHGDVEAQHVATDVAAHGQTGLAKDIPEDVAAEAARVEALWGEANSPTPHGLPDQTQARPAILCRNLRKVKLVREPFMQVLLAAWMRPVACKPNVNEHVWAQVHEHVCTCHYSAPCILCLLHVVHCWQQYCRRT